MLPPLLLLVVEVVMVVEVVVMVVAMVMMVMMTAMMMIFAAACCASSSATAPSTATDRALALALPAPCCAFRPHMNRGWGGAGFKCKAHHAPNRLNAAVAFACPCAAARRYNRMASALSCATP